MTDWWDDMLAEYEQDGARDADAGIFEPPYPGSDDEQEGQENWAYQQGFHRRRKELGERFEWK